MANARRLERRRVLLDAAIEVIAQDGVASASVRTIADRAGMSPGMFHYTFSDKAEMIEAVIEELLTPQREASAFSLAAGGDLAETLRLGFQSPFLAWKERPERHRALIELTLYAVATPELAHLAHQQYAGYFADVDAFLDAVIERFGIDVPDRAAVARYAVAVLDGIALSWLATRDDAAALDALALAADTATAYLNRDAGPAPSVPGPP